MTHAAYPAEDDLAALIESAGLTVPPLLDLQSKLDGAVAEWEARTGWQPYLSTGESERRLFDPPAAGRSLYLQGGLLSLTSLAVGVVPDPTGAYGAVSGSVLVNNLNFYLRPQNAIARGLAITEVEFLSRVRGVPQSVAITGVWGRVLAVPGDVWQTLLKMAALSCAPELALSISRGLAEVREGDEMRRFASSGVSPLSAERDRWEKEIKKMVSDKKRVVV